MAQRVLQLERKMNKFAGLVIDPYDDINGSLISSMLAADKIPEFVKEAELIDPGKSANIPDDNYALVLIDQGMRMRKYATIDKGNTALSVLYLLKQAHFLPRKAVKVAAQNLIEACERYQLGVPPQLKIAAESGAGFTSRPAEDKKESEANPQLGNGNPSQDVKKRTNSESVAGTNFMEVPPFTTKERFADSPGTSIDHEKLASADPELTRLFGANAQTKKRNWRTSPYVDVADWEPYADQINKTASAPSRMLLGGKYPVDSYDQVKMASSYFATYEDSFHPRDRRTYCVKLAERMEELDINVPEHISKYAGSGYGGSVESNVRYRRKFVSEEFHPALDALIEKRAHVKPETFADALEAFDRLTHIDDLWDGQIPDPWSSTFGLSLEKVAEDDWRWDQNGVRVCEGDLDNLAMNGRHLVKRTFGDKFADEFCKSPKTFFEALPMPNKLVLGRLAMDRYSGTHTE